MQTLRDSRTPRRPLFITTLAIVVIASLSPAVGYAQQTHAQPLTAQTLALTAAELGPEWSLSQQQSRTIEGTDVSVVYYVAPSGRSVELLTAVATTVEQAEAVVSVARYELESAGATIGSVQRQGFGDGRAFTAQSSDGQLTEIDYLFRVHNLLAVVAYVGAASASDLQSQAVATARKQEQKLFAALAPPPTPVAAPPAPATPAAVPTPVSAPAPVPAPVAPAFVTSAPAADPYCRPGEQPQFRFGFATLSTQLGARMGSPTSCEYGDPRGSGDTLQTTGKGLSFYRQRTNTPTFTTGFEHWALTAAGTAYWTGDSIDPPDAAELFGG